MFLFMMFLGTLSSFKRNFVDPITQGQQPDCTVEEKEIAESCSGQASKFCFLQMQSQWTKLPKKKQSEGVRFC